MHLCSNMQRTRVKGTMVRQSASPETEPDFSRMPPVGVNHQGNTPQQQMQMATLNYLGSQTQSSSSGRAPTASRSTAYSKGGGEERAAAALSDPSRTLTRQTASTMPPLVSGSKMARPTKMSSVDQSLHGALKQNPPPSSSADAAGSQTQASAWNDRPWGTKYMRHLMTRSNFPQQPSNHHHQQQQPQQSRENPEAYTHVVGNISPGSSSSSSTNVASNSKKNNPISSPTAKVDADLAVFLEEVDLESDNDECLESEEAMARILEQEVSQISQV